MTVLRPGTGSRQNGINIMDVVSTVAASIFAVLSNRRVRRDVSRWTTRRSPSARGASRTGRRRPPRASPTATAGVRSAWPAVGRGATRAEWALPSAAIGPDADDHVHGTHANCAAHVRFADGPSWQRDRIEGRRRRRSCSRLFAGRDVNGFTVYDGFTWPNGYVRLVRVVAAASSLSLCEISVSTTLIRRSTTTVISCCDRYGRYHRWRRRRLFHDNAARRRLATTFRLPRRRPGLGLCPPVSRLVDSARCCFLADTTWV